MTTVSLSELLDIRNESLRVRRRSGTIAYIRAKYAFLRRYRARTSFTWVMPALLAAFGFTSRHILVLFGCAAVVMSAGMVAPALGWLTAGASFFFLEARRR